ncbi:MAG: PrsW family intramembrane metalloprotease [Paludibacteraceae bacterium]|nr:PrsW family intramembrane metalloprotease [Paludibacteraceae bacterium]
MEYYVYRNGSPFGPYNISDLTSLVKAGKVLKCDKLSTVNTATEDKDFFAVRDVLNDNNISVKVDNAGSLTSQLRHISKDLLFPKELKQKETWKSDTRLLVLACIGLFPLVAAYFVPSGWLSYYCIALYFSVVWWSFFNYMFKSPQVTAKTSVTIFFLMQAIVFVAWDALGLPNLNFFYGATDQSYPMLLQLIGFTFGVGFTEEFAKMLPLIWLVKKTKKPLVPQTLVFYGLISGLAFGVYEGVQYQMTENMKLDGSDRFLMNIARLTSLPFIHAIWCAIGGFFISFAVLYPRYRKALWALALFIPAMLHGTYDTMCGNGLTAIFVALPLCVFCVGLLVHYLKNSGNYQNRLR